MNILNTILEPPEPPVHPRLKRWRRLHADGFSLSLKIRRKWNGTIWQPARMIVVISRDDAKVRENVLWESDLNDGLLSLGVRATKKHHEGMRFSLFLRDQFHKVGLMYGEPETRYALVNLLDGLKFSRESKLKEVLGHVAYDKKSLRVPQHLIDMLDHGMELALFLLEHKLHYSKPESLEVLNLAYAQYLTEVYRLKIALKIV